LPFLLHVQVGVVEQHFLLQILANLPIFLYRRISHTQPRLQAGRSRISRVFLSVFLVDHIATSPEHTVHVVKDYARTVVSISILLRNYHRGYFGIYTSAKEVMFLPLLVCLLADR